MLNKGNIYAGPLRFGFLFVKFGLQRSEPSSQTSNNIG
jgi:hypothetical protein